MAISPLNIKEAEQLEDTPSLLKRPDESEILLEEKEETAVTPVELLPKQEPVVSPERYVDSAPLEEPIKEPALNFYEDFVEKYSNFPVGQRGQWTPDPYSAEGRREIDEAVTILPFSEDAQKDALGSAANQFANLQRTLNYLKHRNSLPEKEQQKLDENIKNESAELYKSLLLDAGILANLQEPIFDIDTGRLITTRTALAGTLADFAAPLAVTAVGTGVTRSPVGGLILGSITYQMLAPPEDHLTNMLTDLGFDKAKPAMQKMLHYITTEDLSQESEDRGIMAIEDISLGLGVGWVGKFGVRTVKGINQALMEYAAPIIDQLKKPYDLLTDTEKAEVTFRALRAAGQQIRRQAGGETEGFLSPIKNFGAAVERFARHYTRGLAPRPLREAAERQKTRVRASLKRAGTLTNRLDSLIEELAGSTSTSSAEVREAVQLALTQGFELIPPIGTIEPSDIKKLLRRNKDFDVLSDDVLDTVIEARGMVDDLSNELRSSLELTANTDKAKELLNTLRANVGTYLNTSYRIHNKGWKVDNQLYQDTVDHFTQVTMKRKPSLTPEEARVEALEFVDDAIKNQRKYLGDTKASMENVHRRDTAVLKAKDLEDPALKKLYGEIQDPSENLLSTVAKLSQLVSSSKYFDEIFEQGTTSKYPFLFPAGKRTESEMGVYSYKIEGTNSKLDGMYTTPEVGLILKNREAALTPIFGSLFTKSAIENAGFLTVLGANSLVVNLAEVKGLTQKMKTVWSLQTHGRNAMGGFFMNVAQGHNPFNKEAGQVFKTVFSKSDEELLEFNASLLDLGVINTAPRVAEYRELLTEYKRIMDSDMDEVLGAEAFYNFSRKVSSKLGIGKVNLENMDDLLTKIYMGTDDFFKTSLFLKEKDILKKAYPEMSETALDKEAAEIVKNVMPNYDRIPSGIKALRSIPFLGSFVGFSAEVLRTGGRTLTQASKELLSGNPVLMKRGSVRLASFGLVAGASSKAAEQASATAIGWTTQQLEAVKTFYAPKESEISSYGPQTWMFVENEEGQIDKIDLTWTDPWTTMRQPYTEATQARINGDITEAEEKEIKNKAALAWVKGAIRPFVSETIANQAVADFAYTLNTGKRLGPRGYIADIDQENPLPDALINLIADLGPNIIKEVKEFKDIMIDEEAVGVYVEPKDKEDYLFKRGTTLPRSPVSLLVDLERRVRTYKYKASKASPANLRKTNSYEDLVKKYQAANEQMVQAAQELYIDFKAVEDFYSVSAEGRKLARDTIEEYTSDDKDLYLISKGQAPSMEINSETLYTKLEALRVEGKLPFQFAAFDEAMNKLATEIRLSPEERDLNKGQSVTEQTILPRERKAEGGLNLYSRVSRFGEEQAAKHFGITPEVLEKYTKDTADLVNTLVDKGFFNERERAKPNKEGNLSGGDVFNAANHLRTAALAKDNITLRNLAQLKELAQFVAGDRGPHGALGDSKNNLLGFKFYDQAKGDKEKFDALVAHNLVERFSKRKGKAVGGEVDVPNAAPEPDERIDKMTGLPYNLQAGIPFRDEEDPLKRLGLAGGGRTGDPLHRLGFAAGSRLVKGIVGAVSDASERGAKEFEGVIEQIELGAEQVSNAFKYLIDAKGVDEVASGKGKAPVVKKSTDMSDNTLRPYEEVPKPATYDEMHSALKSNQKEKINVKILDGERVGLRLDIDAYTKHDTWVPTLHPKKGKTSHRATVSIKNVDLMPTQREQEKAQEVLKRQKSKSPFARIDGDLVNRTDEENYRLAQEALNDPAWTQVGYNPDRHSYFFDRATGEPVISGEEAIQIGPLVLVKKAVPGSRDKFKYVSGGLV